MLFNIEEHVFLHVSANLVQACMFDCVFRCQETTFDFVQQGSIRISSRYRHALVIRLEAIAFSIICELKPSHVSPQTRIALT